MTEFTEDALTRPLFVEPTDDIVREDAWSGPFGLMIGGMSLPTKPELSQQFFNAANLLVESIKQREIEDYKLVNPILFLYRHSVELMLKSVIMNDVNHHKLDVLADNLARIIKERSGKEVPAWVIARLKELAKFDPNSTAFRYAENRDKTTNKYVSVDGEIYVGLIHLQQAMMALYATLASIIGFNARESMYWEAP